MMIVDQDCGWRSLMRNDVGKRGYSVVISYECNNACLFIYYVGVSVGYLFYMTPVANTR